MSSFEKNNFGLTLKFKKEILFDIEIRDIKEFYTFDILKHVLNDQWNCDDFGVLNVSYFSQFEEN